MDVLFEAYALPPGQAILWPPSMNILLKRLLEARYILIQKNPFGGADIGGFQISPDFLMITPEGRAFIVEFGQHEL